MTLTAARIAARLDELGAGGARPLTVAAVTGSTNDDARRAMTAGAPHGAAFVADEQTAGRGRRGRPWHSPPGRSLHLSLVLRPGLAPALVPPLGLAVGVAVARTVDGVLGAWRAAIKWPNDVLVDGRKLAGVLIETATVAGEPPALVVGVGLNVRGSDLPADLADIATTLASAGARAVDRSRLCAELIVAIEATCAEYVRAGLDAVRDDLERRDALRGRQVEIGGLTGLAMGLDAAGRLEVRDGSGAMHALCAGEVGCR